MRFSWFLALRYLKPKRTFVSVITLISIAGVTLGVGVLLVVIAVMSGFEKKIKEEFLKVEPSIIVRDESRLNGLDVPAAEAEDGLPAWQGILSQIRQHPEVLSASPMLVVAAVTEKKPTDEEEAILEEHGGFAASVQSILYGISPDDSVQIERLQKWMDESGAGQFDVAGDGIVLTRRLAAQLGRDFPVLIEDSEDFPASRVNGYGPAFLTEYRNYYNDQQRAKDDPERKAAVEEKDRDLPLPEEYTVKGVFDGGKIGNEAIGFISLKNAQRISGAGKGIDGISVELKDPFRAGEVGRELTKDLPEGWTPETWMERHSNYFDAIASERAMMYFVLSIICVVAAFSIMNTMITVAVQKRREIGMMRALGATTRQIVGVFVAKGVVVASLGTGLGYVVGMLVLHFRNQIRAVIAHLFNIRIFDENVYGLREIPADPRMLDNFLICAIAFVLCTLAAVPPAWVVGRLEPARALRSDR